MGKYDFCMLGVGVRTYSHSILRTLPFFWCCLSCFPCPIPDTRTDVTDTLPSISDPEFVRNPSGPLNSQDQLCLYYPLQLQLLLETPLRRCDTYTHPFTVTDYPVVSQDLCILL